MHSIVNIAMRFNAHLGGWPGTVCPIFALLATSLCARTGGAANHDPSHLLGDPEALSHPEELPVAPQKTSIVFRAEKNGYQFNLHSYLTRYEGKFWSIWSSGLTHEDSPKQLIRYAFSEDGHHWSDSGIVTEPEVNPKAQGVCIARGVFVLDGELTALVAFFEKRSELSPTTAPDRAAYPEGWPDIWSNLKLVKFVWDGQEWKDKGVFLDNCMSNFPPRPIDGRLVMTCRDSKVKLSTVISEDQGGGNWTRTILPGAPPGDFLTESSWYVDPEGVVHLLGRDDRRSKYLYHSLSRDNGLTWETPVRTNYPDAMSKNFTGRLSNGWYFLINNPVRTGRSTRDPMAISFSRDGWTFGNPLAVRKNAPPQRFPGRSKSPDSFQYMHALEFEGALWVVYSTNKEDIEISEFRITDILPSN
jgi:hypothetical protein